jgi:hypothetical protein
VRKLADGLKPYLAQPLLEVKSVRAIANALDDLL